jgi:hypothetical protein
MKIREVEACHPHVANTSTFVVMQSVKDNGI